MRVLVKFSIDGIDLSVAFDCDEKTAHEMHDHIIRCASKQAPVAGVLPDIAPEVKYYMRHEEAIVR
jgi:hypothetical protein